MSLIWELNFLGISVELLIGFLEVFYVQVNIGALPWGFDVRLDLEFAYFSCSYGLKPVSVSLLDERLSAWSDRIT